MAKDINYAGVVAEMRRNFDNGLMKSLESRLKQLNQLHCLLKENEEDILLALNKDLHKCKGEALICEVFMLQTEIVDVINALEGWMQPEKAEKNTLNKANTVEIQRDPLGVVLILGAWNYPALLSIQPVVGALAAGNCVILKPSEVAVHTSFLLADLFPKYLDQNCVKVINGGVPESTALLKCRFDHILYTGGTAVGKIVMRAAAEYLTPVTLELGGKSPAIVDSTCDFDLVAQRIAWGKYLNCGQTCLAVDYVLCIGGCQDQLLTALKKAVVKFYGEDAQESDSYGRIINKRHFQRLSGLIDDDKVVLGNVKDETDLYISPTIVANVQDDASIMKEEIFGPILILRNSDSLDDAIEYIKEREKPLALYMFSNDTKGIERVKKETSSGGMVVNDVFTHFAVPSLPFGGVGNSGMGSYHGKHSFDTFSHKKAFVQTKQSMEALQEIRYPPYNEEGNAIKFLRWFLIPKVKGRGLDLTNILLPVLLLLGVAIMLPHFNFNFM